MKSRSSWWNTTGMGGCLEPAPALRAHDADDLEVGVSHLHPPADSASAEVTVREHVVHDDQRRLPGVRRLKQPSLDRRESHRLEVVAMHAVDVQLHVLAGPRHVSGNAEEAPGTSRNRHHSREACPLDAGNRADRGQQGFIVRATFLGRDRRRDLDGQEKRLASRKARVHVERVGEAAREQHRRHEQDRTRRRPARPRARCVR